MNSFDRFKRRNGIYRDAAQKEVNSHFIVKGYPSIKITAASQTENTEPIQAAVVHKDEKDEGYIYTPLNSPLSIGSVWKAKTLNMLIDREVVIIKDVNWHKYHYITCNIECGDGWYGYFIGPEKKHIDIQLQQNVVLTSQSKPLLVAGGKPLDFQDKIMIKGRVWVVDEYDNISTDGITYYSLMPSTMSKEVINEHEGKDEIYIEKNNQDQFLIVPDNESGETNDKGAYEIARGSIIDIVTEEGYFKSSNRAIKVKKHTSNMVSFEVPFGISNFTIEYKKKGAVESRSYSVVDA